MAGHLITHTVGTLCAADGKGKNGKDAYDGKIFAVQCVTGDITHTLRAEGFDASEDGTGRGQPIIVVHGTQDPCVSTDTAFALGRNNGGENAIAFSCKDHGGDAGPISPTLRSMGHDGSHANAGGQVAVVLPFDTTQITSASNYSSPKSGDPCHPLAAGAHAPAVAVSLRGRDGGATAELGDEVQNCLRASGGGGDKAHALTSMGVRRLTPAECEKLQGFPPGYTAIPWRKKPASDCPDGPRYKALGNSWAVPCVRWIGRRIQRAIEPRRAA